MLQTGFFDKGAASRCRSSGESSALSGLSFFEQKLKKFKIQIPPAGTESEDSAIGPYGLNLIYEPPEPLIDFVFVHGLRGGSIKTWRKRSDAQYFWPQAWLPFDPELQNVRIHSFGYNSDWSERKDSILNIHDFGRSLLGEMITSPYLRKDGATPIVLIGHSMGGLVIKKAYILARQQDSCESLAARIRCAFFLATPHRGSDSATLLNNILRSSGAMSARPYVADLGTGSVSLQIINDEFRHYADQIDLWSFYEVLKTKIGISSTIIVDKDSATLGYKHERIFFLNASHRDICKFEDPSDPNFITLRNSLVTTVHELVGNSLSTKNEERRSQMRNLQSYLNVTEMPDDDLANQEDFKTPGSCSWVEERKCFEQWRDCQEETVQYYWLSGKPAAGKSVIAAHVIAHLHGQGLDCSYYFFKHGDKAKQVLSRFLRSIAFQMALVNRQIRQLLSAMQEDNVQFDKDDERAIWRKLFVGGVLRVQIGRPQYWVFDALDECVNNSKLFTLLSKIDSMFPLRIFITSRMSLDLERQFGQLSSQVCSDRISTEDTLTDIRLYLNERIEHLPVDDPQDRDELMEKILSKSAGCFLWVRLVLNELQNVWTEDQIQDVLEEIPIEMEPFYTRSLEMMSLRIREKKLAQTILYWTVCSTRPLKAVELQYALRLHMGVQVRSLEKSVEALCGHFLQLDKNGAIRTVHSTAREFLLNKDLTSEFAVKRHIGHQMLATTCLRFLAGDNMRGPRSRKLVNSTHRPAMPEFVDYACTAFSEHLVGAMSENDELMLLLTKFLRTNALTWIEYIARRKNLYYLTRTAKNFKTYLERRAKYVSPISKELQAIYEWATDLIRLVAKFGTNLILNPSAIYFLIPPFCPSDSIIHKQYGHTPGGLVTTGLSSTTWEDCVSVIAYRNSRATAVACGENVFAIGMKSGYIIIHNQMTCQEIRSMQHGEPIRILQFENVRNLLASGGAKILCLWNNAGEQLWSHDVSHNCIAIVFSQDGETLVTASRNNEAVWLDVGDGSVQKLHSYEVPTQQGPQGTLPTPLDAAFSPDLRLLALIYRGKPICIWSLDDDEMIGCCEEDSGKSDAPNTSVETALFNPNPGLNLLAVAYQDGQLVLYDPWLQAHIKSVDGDAYSLASTPDGRTLATGSASGIVQIWDFETLVLMYRIDSYDLEVKSIAFSCDGFRIVDIRDQKSKVWEPAILVRKLADEDASASEATNLPAVVAGTRDDELVRITAIASYPAGKAIFVGKDDGTVSEYSAVTGRQSSRLYTHGRNVFVTILAWSDHGLLASADAGSKILVWKIQQNREGKWTAIKQVAEVRINQLVKQLSMSPRGDRLLIAGSRTNSLWSLAKDPGCDVASLTPTNKVMGRWITSPMILDRVMLVDQSEATFYEWNDLSKVNTLQWNSGSVAPVEDLDYNNMAIDAQSKYLVANLCSQHGVKKTVQTMIWQLISSDSDIEQADVPPLNLDHLNETIIYFLGLNGSRFVFLDKNLWVCSVDLNTFNGRECVQHFPIPNDFLGSDLVLAEVMPDGVVVFAKDGELAVVKGGLEFEQVVAL